MSQRKDGTSALTQLALETENWLGAHDDEDESFNVRSAKNHIPKLHDPQILEQVNEDDETRDKKKNLKATGPTSRRASLNRTVIQSIENAALVAGVVEEEMKMKQRMAEKRKDKMALNNQRKSSVIQNSAWARSTSVRFPPQTRMESNVGPGIYDNANIPSKVATFSIDKSTGRRETKVDCAMLEHLGDEKSTPVEVTELIWVAQMRQRLGRWGVSPDQLSKSANFKPFRAKLEKAHGRKSHKNAYGTDISIQNLLDDYVNNKTEETIDMANISSEGARQQNDRRRNKYDQLISAPLEQVKNKSKETISLY